ncbi:uncharacterized protein LOC107049643 isoform X2 [Gallus gallus]|uniref:uncharacterized protein LOC107049643 isoform X2 n=1 Tax=Gallus gallus TaxID=9031 RepID=UPI001AE348F6|nr:uncharacterized protein LOC107049643 isoform X2 [Gallus gallus]XP_040537872.1 uncharacterized protein LOC107049643 isoform X2 [Gallus gallus]XP_040537873.1 uncharacterized protein LOC107049643 isoform X2 [Gallus gallus]
MTEDGSVPSPEDRLDSDGGRTGPTAVPLRRLPLTARHPRGTGQAAAGTWSSGAPLSRTEPRSSTIAPAPSWRLRVRGRPSCSALPLVGPPRGAGTPRGGLSLRRRTVIASSPRTSRMAPARLSAALPAAMCLLRFHGPGAAGPRLGLEEEEEEEEEEGEEEEKEKEKEGEEKEGGDVVDLSETEPALPRSMRAFLESGELLAALFDVYGGIAKEDITDSIKSEVSGDLEDALLAVVKCV